MHTHVPRLLNWNSVCMGTSISASRLVHIQTFTCIHMLKTLILLQKKNAPWNIPVTGPIELPTRVSLLNHSCWDSEPISRVSLQAPESSARYPVVPLLCWPSDGRMGNKKQRGRNATGLTFQGIKSCLERTKSDVGCWFQSKECFRELRWLHALHSNNKKDSNPFVGPSFNLYFGKLEKILRFVCKKNTKLLK